MNSYLIWAYIHILLFVFWVGTDVGVFILGKFAQSPNYSVDQRTFGMKVALIIDRFPRLCFVLIIPVGMHLANVSGAMPLDPQVERGIWIASAVWLGIVLLGFFKEGTPTANVLRNIERVFQLVIIVSFSWAGITSLTGNGPAMVEWFAIKLLVFAGISLAALGLDFIATPLSVGFERLKNEGASPEINRSIVVGLNRIYAFVVVIYILAIAAGFLGTVKYPV